MLLAGTALVIFGIVLCSVGGSRRTPAEGKHGGGKASGTQSNAFKIGLANAILAGILSCLPNVGVAFSGNVIAAARTLGVSPASAGNTVWALLFTLGFVANLAYCLYRMISKNTLGLYWNREAPRNLGLSALMALMWIGSFYFYGAGATRLGRWGAVVGWPLFISLSIVVGNLWGLWRGEWRGAPAAARRMLNLGLLVLIVAVIAVALSNSFYGVGRTLLSDAFDLRIAAPEARIRKKEWVCEPERVEIKSGGQECPPHIRIKRSYVPTLLILIEPAATGALDAARHGSASQALFFLRALAADK